MRGEEAERFGRDVGVEKFWDQFNPPHFGLMI